MDKIPYRSYRYIIKRGTAMVLAAALLLAGLPLPLSSEASGEWPQKSTAPYYCLDGGKPWKQTDRYENYRYDTLPGPLSDTQARRLFWAYPDNWESLKRAAKIYDEDLYKAIASTVSGPNVVKKVKDDANSRFAWVADNPEIEARAISAVQNKARESMEEGKVAPELLREATTEENAAAISVRGFLGPASLDTEVVLGEAFIRDIAQIEPQSVWDNGSTGGAVGWLDASQDQNIAKSVLGENLYELTWSGDSLKIHNNGSALANENALNSQMSLEEKYNKTTVRYKITMRKNSGWFTEGSWNDNYIRDWMYFKACVNAPGHQRLYRAEIKMEPATAVFYLVIDQTGEDTDRPEYEGDTASVDFKVYRHTETFKADYNVRLKKMDAETGKPVKGSQFYLYERFEDRDALTDGEKDGGLTEENLSFVPWEGFKIFSDGVTDENGEISHRDHREYNYNKTYCNGHPAPDWAEIPEEAVDPATGEAANEKEIEQSRDENRAAASVWISLQRQCEEEDEESDTHFHWLADEDMAEDIAEVLESGDPAGKSGSSEENNKENSFLESGCKKDCEISYDAFINLEFTYTWKEIQAAAGYILHGLHKDDVPIEWITTNSSQAGAKSRFGGGYSSELDVQEWYDGNGARGNKKDKDMFPADEETGLGKSGRGTDGLDLTGGIQREYKTGLFNFPLKKRTKTYTESSSDAEYGGYLATSSDAVQEADSEEDLYFDSAALWESQNRLSVFSDTDWENGGGFEDFRPYLKRAEADGIRHLTKGEESRFSHCNDVDDCGGFFRIYDHRTEGRIHINKRNLDLYRKENEEYSSYGESEGDATLEGAVYGLFAAEPVVHPDTWIGPDGSIKNTGIVYRQNDLVAVATTDKEGNADFLAFTEAPGMTYLYEEGKIGRQEPYWKSPENFYQEKGFKENYDDYSGDLNQEGVTVRKYQNLERLNGNPWIGRPLILGNYYIKELSRSEGYELSVNGIKNERTNAGAGVLTPPEIADAHGSAVVSLPELSASMEGEDGRGNGYDRLPFTVTSKGTVDRDAGTDGYDLLVFGFPADTVFYRLDRGEEEVTGPRVTGSEEVPVTDADGRQVWRTAAADGIYLKYRPIYNDLGAVIGQEPMTRDEWQTMHLTRVPLKEDMVLDRLEFDPSDPRYGEPVDCSLVADESGELYRFIKAEVERSLAENGYDIPLKADGSFSTDEEPVYSRGVKKGQTDYFGMTVPEGETAIKTVYGAAVVDLLLSVQDMEDGTDATVLKLILTVLSWYQEHPEWSFGGIDGIEETKEGCRIRLYAGATGIQGRQFFTAKSLDGELSVNHIYTVHENPAKLRWEYQRYDDSGDFYYEVSRQYSLGSGGSQRYYVDALVAPAVMAGENGALEGLRHQVMVYHEKGEEIKDYIDGDPMEGYRVPLTKTKEKIEITTEMEEVEKETRLPSSYDAETGIHTIHINAEGTDAFGKEFSDESGSLTLAFLAVTEEKNRVLTKEDILSLGAANVNGYEAGDRIGYVQYLMFFGDASVGTSVSSNKTAGDTYIVTKRLIYGGQKKTVEDGKTADSPVLVLERPIKQKIRVIKRLKDSALGETALGNFRFKLYLKSNLKRIYRDRDGSIVWLDRAGKPVDVFLYKKKFPELVQRLDTRITEKTYSVVEKDNYEKFFDAIRTANQDVWHRTGELSNTSYKPFAYSLITGKENTVNTSDEAKENAKRSDAVRQFAIDWYWKEAQTFLKKEENGTYHAVSGAVSYSEEIFDQTLYQAILLAEEYLKPFFLYDLDEIYAILWDSDEKGGIDGDFSTLAADLLAEETETEGYAYGISPYLPYGEYILAEDQPWNPRWQDFLNKHYRIDSPKEISLPAVYEDNEEGEKEPPKELAEKYRYDASASPEDLARQFLIRFNEEPSKNHRDDDRVYVISACGADGPFEIYKYGLDKDQTEGHYEPYGNAAVASYYHYRSDSENAGTDAKTGTATMTGVRTAYDGRYAPMLVPWSVLEEELPEKSEETLLGTAYQTFINRLYQVRLRIEKLDLETGEPVLHEDAVFGIYRAERDLSKDGEGSVLRYQKDTVITGTREFLEAMGAGQITPLAREVQAVTGDEPDTGVGVKYYGTVPSGAPDCKEENLVCFTDGAGKRTGKFYHLSTVSDDPAEGLLQTAGWTQTPEPLKAGGYVLAELKPPGGYVRSAPIVIELYSDDVICYTADGKKTTAIRMGKEDETETARIYVTNSGTRLDISKEKTDKTQEKMRVSGRVEGTISALSAEYGLENLELAYNSFGAYLGFGWKAGTLEYLESRKKAGERVELAYRDGVFQGYGFVTRKLDTADQENRQAAGAKLALYEAIALPPSGDKEDYFLQGLMVIRDQNGNVRELSVKEPFAGERKELFKTGVGTGENRISEDIGDIGDGEWKLKTIKRSDTPVLFYDLGGLSVIGMRSDGSLIGFDRDGNQIQVTSETEAVYGKKDGQIMFELSGGDLTKIVYDRNARAFTDMDADTVLYHLNEEGVRDSLVDSYTGLAYVERMEKDGQGRQQKSYYVWPVRSVTDADGKELFKEKILTGRPKAENSGTENEYITGTWNPVSGAFEKTMNPNYDFYGMVQSYPESGAEYQKGENLYDRDGEYLGIRYHELLESFNRASLNLMDHVLLYSLKDSLERRKGEANVLPNIWITGENAETGEPDILRRVFPGTYILEELDAPEGYAKTMPSAVRIGETDIPQQMRLTDEKIKIEISKIDGTETYRIPVWKDKEADFTEWSREGKGTYSNAAISGVPLALYRAKRVYTTDYQAYPKGYYLVKAEETPARWKTDGSVENQAEWITALWKTDGKARYFEGIPAGDYLLEELEVPAGYLPASMELEIKAIPELQSFILKNDHTKLEILKAERAFGGSDGNAGLEEEILPLKAPFQAVLALYPAVVDESGQVLLEDGIPRYDNKRLLDRWTTGALSEYLPGLQSVYEKMYREYGTDFTKFSWSVPESGTSPQKQKEYHATRISSKGENPAQTVVQVWELSDGSRVRITASGCAGDGRLSSYGVPDITFWYQFHFKETFHEEYPDMVSYDTGAGRHRIDRIPAGVYVLVEERAPDSYRTAPPQVVVVENAKEVQLYQMENQREKGSLLIKKQDAENETLLLSGAEFQVKNIKSGEVYSLLTDENGLASFSGLSLFHREEDGTDSFCIYEIREMKAPEGYKPDPSVWTVRLAQGQTSEICYSLSVTNRKEETPPEETTPEETPPEETMPEETPPEETPPGETTPEETTPEETTPEESMPEETTPEETTPKETIPEESLPSETPPKAFKEEPPEEDIGKPEKKAGKITADYRGAAAGRGILYLDEEVTLRPGTGNGKIPKTGDDCHLAVWLIICLISGGMGIWAVYRKRKLEENTEYIENAEKREGIQEGKEIKNAKKIEKKIKNVKRKKRRGK